MTPVATATDPHGWWPYLLDGLVGSFVAAVVGAAVAAWIALRVVERTQRADRRIARELAAYEAAKTISLAAYKAVERMGDLLGHYDQPDDHARERVSVDWSAHLSMEYPALHGFVAEAELTLLTDALARHRDRVGNAAANMLTRDAHGRMPDDTRQTLNAVEIDSLRALGDTATQVHAVLDAFRRQGAPTRR